MWRSERLTLVAKRALNVAFEAYRPSGADPTVGTIIRFSASSGLPDHVKMR
jgi:hypothetical protein